VEIEHELLGQRIAPAIQRPVLRAQDVLLLGGVPFGSKRDMRGDQVAHLLDCQWRRSGIGRIEEVSQSSVPEEAWVGFADNLIEVRFSFPRLHLLVFE
jgi:hypothetical protein